MTPVATDHYVVSFSQLSGGIVDQNVDHERVSQVCIGLNIIMIEK
jgi:hypothetical protein